MSFYVMEYRYSDQEARARVRPDHLTYLQALADEGKVVLAGPVDDGSGALMVLHVDSEEQARQIIADDPYTASGVGVDHVLRAWDVVVPTQPE